MLINLHKKILGEVPMTYNGGGGKSGGAQTAPAPVMQTTTTLGGDELSVGTETLTDDTVAKEDALSIKKKGTRGLQIPMASGNQTTTAAATGIQV